MNACLATKADFFRGEVSLEDFIPETTLILTGVYYYEPRRVHIIEIRKNEVQ